MTAENGNWQLHQGGTHTHTHKQAMPASYSQCAMGNDNR